MRHKKDSWQAAMDQLSTAVFLTDSLGTILWGNGAAEMLLETSRKSFTGTHISERLPECEEWFRHLAEGSQLTSARLVARLLRLKRGTQPEEIHIQAVLSPVTELYAAFPKASALVEVVEVEDTLLQDREQTACELMEVNRQLLRNLAHEIKNPLGGIRGAAQLLESDLVRAEDRECTSIIIGEADRLQALVDRFLAPYRQVSSKEPVNLHETLEHVKSLVLMEYPHHLTFVRDYDISAPAVMGDKARLTQVFLNLVKNAAEAMTKERALGTAKITLRTRIVRDVLIGSERVRLALAAEVIDNGPGIPVEMQEKVFYPLVTGRAEGSGLGLSLVQTFVRQGGGAILLESEPGRTCFRVLLPLTLV